MKKRFALLISMLIGVCVCSGIGAACAETNKSGNHKHTFSSEWSAKDAYSHWHAATCGHTDLGEDEETHEIGDDYRCKVCGYSLIPTEGLIRELNEDGKSYSIIGVDRYIKDVDIVIPLQYDGLPVTAISKGAFSEKNAIKSIRMPITVTSIGANAFYNCVNLIEISIPNYVTSIGEKAFYGCFSLECVSLGSSISSIGEDAFAKCSNIKQVDIANLAGWCNTKLGNLNSSPFSNGAGIYIEGEHIEDLVIPGTVTKLEQNVFNNLTLTSITLPDSVVEIRNNAFYGFKADTVKYEGSVANWCKISFANNYANPLNAADSFYSNNKKITELVISNIEIVEQYAFAGFKGVTSLYLEAMETVGNCAFSDCINLTDLKLSDSVISLYDSAFSGCVNLKNIEFGNNVKYIGNNAFLNCKLLSNLTIPESVVNIGESAFKNCTNLISITLNNGLAEIGVAAFEGCYKLVELYNLSLLDITLGSNTNGSVGLYALDIYTNAEEESKLVTTESGCIFYNGLEEKYIISYVGSDNQLILPGNFNGQDYGIYAYAFCYRDNLTKIVIPDSILSIGVSAFDNCKGLTYNEYSNGLYLALDSNPYGILIKIKDTTVTSVTINSGAKMIADCAFMGSNISSITIPDSVISLGERTFYGCSNLYNVVIPNGLKSIGARAFYACSAVENISLPESVTSIGDSAFFSCTGLKKLVLPNGIAEIGTTPFEMCPLEEISIPAKAISYIPKSNLTIVTITSGERLEKNAFKDCTKITSISLPDSITCVEKDAFTGCTNLNYYEDENGTYLGNSNNHHLVLVSAKNNKVTEFTLSEKTKIIYDEAFYQFAELKSINLDGITSIGRAAFMYCTKLESAVTADSAAYIGEDAFNNCDSLKSFTVPEGVSQILGQTFKDCSNLENVKLPDNIDYIAGSAFVNCPKLKYEEYKGAYYLGNTEKPYLYLIKATDLGTCTIHEDARYVVLSAFNSVEMSTTTGYIGKLSNPYLFLLYGKDNSTVNERTEYIAEYAFTEYSNRELVGTALSTVTIPDSVKYIGESAFSCNRRNLTTLYIGSGVIRIDGVLFDNCFNLKDIYYDGTYAQWNSIITYVPWDYSTGQDTGTTLHCADGNFIVRTKFEGIK